MNFLPKLAQLNGRLSWHVYLLSASASFVVFFFIWQLVASSYSTTEWNRLIPYPWSVVNAAIDGIFSRGWLVDVWVSSYRIFLGFVVSALFAIPVGVLMGSFRIVEAILEPFHSFIRYMPVVAFIPLFIIWLGIDDLQKIIVIFVGTYFQLVLMVASAASRVPRQYVEIYHMFGGRRIGCLFKVVLPAAWPSIYSSLRIAAAWAWSYLVVAELVSAEVGIGFKIIQNQRFLHTPQVMAAILIVGILGILTDLAFRLLSKWCLPWFWIYRS